MIERFGYKNIVAAVYISALFMQIMDGTIINVALPTLAEEFNADATSMDWTVLSFTLALGVMTPTAGWVGDRFGLKRTFIAALGGFVLASILCGASQSLAQLVAARAVQGGFAGLITPAGSALLFNAFPIEERSDAARKVITVAVIAPALGPIVGGAILEYFSWRWIFFVNIPIGGVALAMALRGLRRDEPGEAGRFDIAGFVLAATGLGLLLYGMSRVGERGWGSPIIQASLLGGVFLLTLLVFVELRQENPLLAFRVVATRIFALTNLIAIPVYAGFLALVYLLPLLLQDVGGRSPLEVGLALFPQPLGVLVMSQATSRLYKRLGPRRLIFVGSILALAIGVAISTIEPGTSLWTLRVMMFIRGLAMGLLFIPIQSAVYAKTKPQQMSRATSMFGTTRQVAPALGVALGSTVLAAGIAGPADEASADMLISSYQRAMLVTALLFGVAALLSLLLRDEDAAATMAPPQERLPVRKT